jgi:quercetin dioxygenase-like cupin family protein
VSRPQAPSTVHVDNDRVRVTEWRFAPGEATGWHRHEYDYVIVPVLGGTLSMDTGTGTTAAEIVPGGAYFREAGVEHDVANETGAGIAFVEIELKQPG